MKEFTVELCNKSFAVKPDFRRIQLIESTTGKGTLEIAQDIAGSRHKITDIVSVLFCMVRDSKLTQDQIAEEVVGNTGKFLPVVIDFLAACNFGSDELDGEGGGTEGND